jgi:HK97 family phage prohead protease
MRPIRQVRLASAIVPGVERRYAPAGAALGITTRDAGEKIGSLIEGFAAVYYDASDPDGTQYQLYEGLMERLMPGCFDRCLRGNPDIVGLLNHDQNWILGRTVAGTMKVTSTSRGLKYTIDPNPELAPAIMAGIKRGDLRGSSFAFTVVSQRWVTNANGPDVRELIDLDCWDCSIVTMPAYSGTSVGARHDQRDAVYEQWQRERRATLGRSARDREEILRRVEASARADDHATRAARLDPVEAELRAPMAQQTFALSPYERQLHRRAQKAIHDDD